VVDGEALVLRPTFAALVAAEEELGPLFALVERAADGKLVLGEIAALFDHVSAGRREGITRARIGEAIVASGLANVTPQLPRLERWRRKRGRRLRLGWGGARTTSGMRPLPNWRGRWRCPIQSTRRARTGSTRFGRGFPI